MGKKKLWNAFASDVVDVILALLHVEKVLDDFHNSDVLGELSNGGFELINLSMENQSCVSSL